MKMKLIKNYKISLKIAELEDLRVNLAKIWKKMNDFEKNISGGRQRIGIARALYQTKIF